MLLTTGLANAQAPHEMCPHVASIIPPDGCILGDELTAYERGYRNGVFMVNYAYDSFGDCTRWPDIEALIGQLKDYFGALPSVDSADLCRLGGITDAISDREAELLGPGCCCCAFPTCSMRGSHEGQEYADTYCMMALAADACFDPSIYTRGPVVTLCSYDFERSCVHSFATAVPADSPCFIYTNNDLLPACLEPFANYRDRICDAQ